MRHFEHLVQLHLDGLSSEEDLEILQNNRNQWIEVLFRFLEQTDQSIFRVRRKFRGADRRTILDDLNSEAEKLDKVLTNLLGPAPEPSSSSSNGYGLENTNNDLQLAWRDGRLVAWLGAYKSHPEGHEEIINRLGQLGANSIEWEPSENLQLPEEKEAPSVSAPISSTLGWLVSLGSDRPESIGVTAIWMGLAAG